MVDKLDELIIPRSTVESIGRVEIGKLMIGFAWRSNVWRKPAQLIQVVAIQMIGAGIVFAALMLPIDRGLGSYLPPRSQSTRSIQLVWIDGIVTIVILGGINRYILNRGQRCQRLIKLVAQIEDYNQIVDAVATLAAVASLTNHSATPAQTSSMIEILGQTRQNLLTALQIDSYLRQYPDSSELTLSIAHNLIALQDLAQQPQLAEYGTLLTQAWEIGMSVYGQRSSL